jgi:hypothetical protein
MPKSEKKAVNSFEEVHFTVEKVGFKFDRSGSASRAFELRREGMTRSLRRSLVLLLLYCPERFACGWCLLHILYRLSIPLLNGSRGFGPKFSPGSKSRQAPRNCRQQHNHFFHNSLVPDFSL